MKRQQTLTHASLAQHTSWRVGGTADQLYQPADIDDLAVFLRSVPSTTPITWLGLGSNVLVRDGGVRGVVILTTPALGKLTQLDAHTVRAEAGVPCAKVARFCARQGLTGVEFFAGIPGTVGGALAMNAGAFGGETWPHVAQVETLDRHGVRRTRAAQDYQVSYRHVVAPAPEWFVAADFRLEPGDGEHALATIKDLLERRNRTQPTQQPSCGSVFRNPPGDHAARLIEASGLKGVCIGGACVSEKHANFIVNTGTATAADIEALIAQVAITVEQRHGVRLIPEVHMIGVAVAEGTS